MYLSSIVTSQASGYSFLKLQSARSSKFALLAITVLSASVTCLLPSFVCLPSPTISLLSCPRTASSAMVSSSREHSVDDFLVQGPVSSSNGRRPSMKSCLCRRCRCLKGCDDCFVEVGKMNRMSGLL
uniref:Candidate secreted effector n=1 Tax=Meloidogyne incognita TaxID=6306 RepID=A0A914L5Z7_MELIC